jgi:hypothetical protein
MLLERALLISTVKMLSGPKRLKKRADGSIAKRGCHFRELVTRLSDVFPLHPSGFCVLHVVKHSFEWNARAILK